MADETITTTETQTETKGPDLAKSIEGLLTKHGGQDGALRVLLTENHGYRDQLREVKGKLPPEGSVILTADEAKVLASYRQHGTPEDVGKAFGERDTFKGQVETRARQDLHAEIATAAGYKPAVLSRLATQDNLTLVLVDDKDRQNKDVKVPHVKGEGDKTVPLSEYAEKNWKDFMPALKAEAQQPPARGGPTSFGNTAPPRPATTTTTQATTTPRRNAFG